MTVWRGDVGRERSNYNRILTSLETFQPLLNLLLVLLALLDLLQLHLLAELLALTLLPLLLRTLETRALVEQALSDALHMCVALDHLREVVGGTGEWKVVLLGQGASGLCAVKCLFITGMRGRMDQTEPSETRGRTTYNASSRLRSSSTSTSMDSG